MRWRVEEFHRTWKSGETDVESTQLEVGPRRDGLGDDPGDRRRPHRAAQAARAPAPGICQPPSTSAPTRSRPSRCCTSARSLQSPSHHRSSSSLARRARRLRGEVLEETEARRRRARPWPTHPPTRRPPAGDPARGGKVGESESKPQLLRGRACDRGNRRRGWGPRSARARARKTGEREETNPQRRSGGKVTRRKIGGGLADGTASDVEA